MGEIERAAERYIGGEYTAANEGFSDHESHIKALEFIKLVSKAKVECQSLLDFGCGGGGFLRNVTTLMPLPDDARLLGYDINPDAIDFANKNKTDERLHYTSIPPGNLCDHSSFDIASVVHVLEHLPNWEDCLLELSSYSNYIYVVIPLEASLWHSLRANTLKRQYIKYGHIHFFNHAYFVHRVIELGFKIEAEDFSHEFMAFKSLSAQLIKWPRRLGGLISKRMTANLLGGYCLQLLLSRE
jgi:SAM-dependent methyltransferase